MKAEVSAEAAKPAHTLNRLLQIAFGYVGTNTLVAGIECGVFDSLADGPISLDELAAKIHIKPIACRRLLMALASLDLVKCEDGKFSNTDLGQFCTDRASVNLAATVRMSPFRRLSEYLPDALREYSPRWNQAFDAPAGDAFAALYADPAGLQEFAELMDGFSIPQGLLIAEYFDFSRHHRVMDVAGGPGGQLIQIGLKHPHLEGIVTDLEPMCAIAQQRIEASGLSARFSAVAADLVEGPYPSGADVILLGHILHDWGDATCLKILGNCARALPAGGVLLISESVLDSDFSGRDSANLKDMLMLVGNESDARERSEAEYRALLDQTGFDVVEVVQFEAPRDLLVARKR